MALRAAEGINAVIAVLTAIAAASAAYAAYQSARQTELTRLTLLHTEQVQSFDQFINAASISCNSYDDASYDLVWDFSTDDFRKDADLSAYANDKPSIPSPLTPSYPSGESKAQSAVTNMYFLASKLIDLDLNGLSSVPIQQFLDEYGRLPPVNYYPEGAKNAIDQMRMVQRNLIAENRQCISLLDKLMKAYAPIISAG